MQPEIEIHECNIIDHNVHVAYSVTTEEGTQDLTPKIPISTLVRFIEDMKLNEYLDNDNSPVIINSTEVLKNELRLIVSFYLTRQNND